MTTGRVSENQKLTSILERTGATRKQIINLGDQISSGIKASVPEETSSAGSISKLNLTLQRIDSYQTRTANAQSFFAFQDDVLSQGTDLITRAKEIATQAANGTVSSEARSQMAEEVWQLRDHMVSLANSTYQGKYVWSGAQDNTPPFSAATYTVPTTGAASQRYIYGTTQTYQSTRTIQVSDEVAVRVNTPGDQVFSEAIASLERLGRALSGYTTNPANASTLPDGTGVAFVFPTDYQNQTDAIRVSIDELDTARQDDIQIERVSVGARMRRLETATSVLKVAKTSAEEVLSNLQDTDITEAGSKLVQAQTTLEASLSVTSRLLNTSILDFL